MPVGAKRKTNPRKPPARSNLLIFDNRGENGDARGQQSTWTETRFSWKPAPCALGVRYKFGATEGEKEWRPGS
jgi:hypothetical protein